MQNLVKIHWKLSVCIITLKFGKKKWKRGITQHRTIFMVLFASASSASQLTMLCFITENVDLSVNSAPFITQRRQDQYRCVMSHTVQPLSATWPNNHRRMWAWAPAEIFPEGGKITEVLKSWHVFGEPYKKSTIFRRAGGAKENLCVFSRVLD